MTGSKVEVSGMHWLERHWYRITPLHLILLPASFIFRLLSAARRTLYRCGVLHSTKLPVPVIVVGNINVGGSGKTPLTLHLAQQLLDEGWHPGIISRGYVKNARATSSEARPVAPDSDPASMGDEAVLMAQRALCPVWVGCDRVAAAQALLREYPGCDVILSDDGLQHYRLQRSVEIAVVDGTRRFGNGLLLPAGPLREPRIRLREVDAVVVHGGDIPKGAYRMQLHGELFYNLLNPATTALAADFKDMRVHAIAGIGHPKRFFMHLEKLGLTPHAHAFPDHHHYVPADIDLPAADAILMTEKDAVKCSAFANEKCWALRVDAQTDPALLQHILERIAPHGPQAA